MTTEPERDHLDLVRTRFTRTARDFAQFALTTRNKEAGRLVDLAAPRGDEVALDLACGPGTFTRAFAARVRHMCGLDLTRAMLDEARVATARAGLANVTFACGDANALPFADSALGMAVCAYSVHHFLEPARAIGELARVVRSGGRVALADIIVPAGADADWNNRIERARDASHARTLTRGELFAVLEVAGLRLLAQEALERLRQFDDWMQIMGWLPGAPAYAETRRLMEAAIPGDLSGFHARLTRRGGPGAPGTVGGELEFVQTTLLVVAEKP